MCKDVCLIKGRFNVLKTGLGMLAYSMNKEMDLVHSYVMTKRSKTDDNNAAILQCQCTLNEANLQGL